MQERRGGLIYGGRGRRCHRCGFVTAAAAAFLLSLPCRSRRAASTRRGGGSRGGDGGGAEGGGGSERRASAHTPVISLHSRVAAEAGPLGFNYLNVGPLLRHASGMRRASIWYLRVSPRPCASLCRAQLVRLPAGDKHLLLTSLEIFIYGDGDAGRCAFQVIYFIFRKP